MPTEFVLTEKIRNLLLKRGFTLVCDYQKCKKALKIGDKIISKKNGTYSRRKFYHSNCWNSLFLDC